PLILPVQCHLSFLFRRQRRSLHWVYPLNQCRHKQGDFYQLVAELGLDSQCHHQYFRMSAEQMDDLLSLIGHKLTRQSTNYRAEIKPKQRLAVASGDSLNSLSFNYHLGHNIMMENFLPRPTQDTWKEVAKRFWEKLSFPNCPGALYIKHIVIQAHCPVANTSTTKRPFSIVLLALVDAEYRFIYIQVGDFGRTSDSGVYVGSDMGRGLENQTLHVPQNTSLPGAAHIGDVPYNPDLMRPYPRQNLSHKKIFFNYRLSRARMVVENLFGILASRWRIFHRRINLQPKNEDSRVVAACILHNFLLAPTENMRLLEEADELGRQMPSVRNMGGNRASREACAVRECFVTFFTSPEGTVSCHPVPV
uniref:DDE Tnp4 domain-containing protein n=1 Tax=Labrus bergylta TaxID=56723 RepID=A0A3Q3EDM0_9LABR